MDVGRFHRRLADSAGLLIPVGSGVVCAVSGGADSMALLYGLHAVSGVRDSGWRLHVAHLDHGLRKDSSGDAAFVKAAAGTLGLGCAIRRVEVAKSAEAAGETVEEAGRRERYAFLDQVARENGTRVVAVGHHADDQAETVLHRIARGTGLRGLAGMPRRRAIREGSGVELVRPLLGFRQAELASYLRARGHSYREDATNNDPAAATRNRIRHDVLPLMSQAVNPQVTTALLRLSEQARRVNDAMVWVAAEALAGARIREAEGEVVLRAEAVAGWPEAIRSEVVLAVLRDLDVGLRAIGFERIEAVGEVACGDGRRRVIELAGGVIVERRGAELCFRVTR